MHDAGEPTLDRFVVVPPVDQPVRHFLDPLARLGRAEVVDDQQRAAADRVIKDINPQRDRGLLRWIAAVVLGTAATVGITLLNLPSSIEGSIIGGSVVLVVGIISGPSTRHALDVVGTIRGSGAP
ncbi:hypothetical protein JOC24_004135 [Streptomyces sp. HB132]|nr:hypothetical protein [Streptomyces sp. HB132]